MRTPGRLSVALSILASCLLPACAPRTPRLLPPPAALQSLGGTGSMTVSGAESALAGRGKFAFLILRDGRARIDVFDPLGRTASVLLFGAERAVLAVPPRRVYWETDASDLLGRFLGFPLAVPDVWRLVTGRWDEPLPASAEAAAPAGPWTLERDDRERVASGRRGDLEFRVTEFFPGLSAARRVSFEDPAASGRIRVLALRWNPPDRPEAFDERFLKRFRAVGWEEMSELLRRE